MTDPAGPGGAAPSAYDTPPPMPSIYASALLETQRLVGSTRRALAALLTARLG